MFLQGLHYHIRPISDTATGTEFVLLYLTVLVSTFITTKLVLAFNAEPRRTFS